MPSLEQLGHVCYACDLPEGWDFVWCKMLSDWGELW